MSANSDAQPEETPEEESAELPDDGYEDDGEMTWESAARQAIQDAVTDMRFDEVRGSIYLMSGHDHRWNSIKEEFRDAESLRHRLIELGEDEWINYVPFESGEPVFEPDVEDWVADALSTNDVEEFFDRVRKNEDDESEELVSADELLNPGAGLVLEIDICEINAELVRYLGAHPEKLRDLTPRKFEELVAELFRDKGYEVVVTPRSKDGGLDIRLIQKSELGRFLILVECKRYGEKNKVGVEIVRQLYGVVNLENATSGLVVTTSFFTRGAKSEQNRAKHRMALADFEELKRWLSAYRRRS